jgi:hypothetical protein
VFAGGDWMPLGRLFVPVLPAFVVAATAIAARVPGRLTAGRGVAAAFAMAFAWKAAGLRARGVVDGRLGLVAQAPAALLGSRVVAAVDVGWPSAAWHGTLVDLAGVTDPAIAALPGGHTTKRVPSTLLDARGVDTLLFLRADVPDDPARLDGGPFARGVEEAIAQDPWVRASFVPSARLRAGTLTYVVLRRAP